MEKQNDPILTNLKSELLGAPFKTAFKATLGFYVAQAVIGIATLVLLGLGFVAVVAAVTLFTGA